MTLAGQYAATAAADAGEVVRRHAPLVKRIAHHLMHRLPPSVQLDDLLQAGMLGLLEAARQYDGTHGASFETYAGIRIRGAMLDEVRRSDWTPRSVHRRHREAVEALQQIERETGREARDAEVAARLGIDLGEYHRILLDGAACRVLSLDEMSEEDDSLLERCPSPGAGPPEHLVREGFHAALAGAIDALPEREKLVVALYYDEELNLKEIGAVIGVGESRVCQILGQAMLRLRAALKGWLGAEGPGAGD
jgi:RNA polymerase sigma factor for flagellar operon FliA